ncbi:DUF3465 domain-containing protein [Agaribacterium sp. ZY112]|uniref:DUF3465 domain-containing protein n=1 Tax=Agaribacterium sp. ZY112 TaxID=3233574 RepID=UPI0035244F37
MTSDNKAICCAPLANDVRLQQAFEHHESDLQVRGSGTISHLLPDDNKGSRYQGAVYE